MFLINFISYYILRAKGAYAGLVSCVAQEAERITNQKQAAVNFNKPAPPQQKMEEVAATVEVKTKLIIDRNVITLDSTQSDESSDGDDDMTGPSKVEEDIKAPSTSAPVDRKRVHTKGRYTFIQITLNPKLCFCVVFLQFLYF